MSQYKHCDVTIENTHSSDLNQTVFAAVLVSLNIVIVYVI